MRCGICGCGAAAAAARGVWATVCSAALRQRCGSAAPHLRQQLGKDSAKVASAVQRFKGIPHWHGKVAHLLALHKGGKRERGALSCCYFFWRTARVSGQPSQPDPSLQRRWPHPLLLPTLLRSVIISRAAAVLADEGVGSRCHAPSCHCRQQQGTSVARSRPTRR